MGLGYKLADIINATYSGGIDVPLDDFSDANIRRLFLTTKRFPKINIKLVSDLWLFSHVWHKMRIRLRALIFQ
jgi:hypothetical protein